MKRMTLVTGRVQYSSGKRRSSDQGQQEMAGMDYKNGKHCHLKLGGAVGANHPPEAELQGEVGQGLLVYLSYVYNSMQRYT